MKIALLVHKLTDGGAERVAVLWANGFQKRGNEVQIIIFDDEKPRTYGLSDSINTVSIVSYKKNRLQRVLDRIIKLRRTLKESHPDVAIEVMPGWQRLISMIGLDVIKISTEHQPFEHPENADRKVNKVSKFWLNRLYDYVTVLTQADKDVIGNRLKRVTILPNPLAIEPVQYVPLKEKIILGVGRKDAWLYKGFDNLIKAWAQVAHDVSGWKLQIVGSSTKGGQGYLETICQDYGVTDSVEFPDYQSDIQPYYQRASIFVLSSRYEGFGLVLIEAMSQGCACVACDYKGRQSEIVTNGVDGVTCEPDNVDALASAIKALIADDEFRTELQVNAIRRASDFSVEHIMDRWEQIFEKCGLK